MGVTDWIDLAQRSDRWRALVSAVMNLRVPQNAGNFLTSCRLVSFSRTLLHGVSKSILLTRPLSDVKKLSKCDMRPADCMLVA